MIPKVCPITVLPRFTNAGNELKTVQTWGQRHARQIVGRFNGHISKLDFGSPWTHRSFS